jgi:hypothetical protein
MISRILWQSSVLLSILLFGCGKQASDSGQAQNVTTPTEDHSHSAAMPFRAPRPFVPGPELAKLDRNSREYYHAWSRFNCVHEYRRCGKTNSVWDSPAIQGLELYCEYRSLEDESPKQNDLMDRCAEELGKAIAAGCDDPLVKYLHVRVARMRKPGSDEQEMQKMQIACADSMEKMDYTSIRKAWASLRAAETMKTEMGESSKAPPRLTAFRRAAVHHLNEALHDPSIPPREASELTKEVWPMAKTSAIGRYDVEGLLMPTLEKLWSKHAFSYWVRGRFYIDKAWRERGNGWADSVAEKGWKGFEENLETAEKILVKGWDADPTEIDIAIAMITVCMGRGHERPKMEQWFGRAMKLNPKSYDAVSAKEYYLEPKWLGSEQQVLEFGRECVENMEWGGHVPLILRDIHDKLQKYHKINEVEYYARDYVWRDVQSSYERFFAINPDGVAHRHNYAADAYRSAKYSIFLEQLPRFTTGTNYNYFGGKEKLNAMIKIAIAATEK